MARPPQYLTAKVEDFGCVLDLAWLRRRLNARSPGDSGRIYWKRHGIEQASVRYTLETGFLRLTYAMRGTGRVIVERLPITTTATRFAGRRHWFSCPDCSRRCRILYGADRFRCRECLGARYESQYQNEAMNISSRRWRLRQLLEERGGALGPAISTMASLPSHLRCAGKPIADCSPRTGCLRHAGMPGSRIGCIARIPG